MIDRQVCCPLLFLPEQVLQRLDSDEAFEPRPDGRGFFLVRPARVHSWGTECLEHLANAHKPCLHASSPWTSALARLVGARCWCTGARYSQACLRSIASTARVHLQSGSGPELHVDLSPVRAPWLVYKDRRGMTRHENRLISVGAHDRPVEVVHIGMQESACAHGSVVGQPCCVRRRNRREESPRGRQPPSTRSI
jgi:hypothetical protein